MKQNSFTKSITSRLFDFIILLGATHHFITRYLTHMHLGQSLRHHFADFHLRHGTNQVHRIHHLYQTCLGYLFQKIQRIHSTYLFID
jgi:hypothetical protein